MTDENRIWDMQPGEPIRWYKRFARYRDAGPGRSLRKLYEEHKPHAIEYGKRISLPGVWKAAAQHYNWQERVQAYDAHVDSVNRAAQIAALVDRAPEWARRDAEIRDQAWDLAQVLMAKADMMLDWPLEPTVSDDGNTITLPARWRFIDAAKLLKVGMVFGKVATEIPPEVFIFMRMLQERNIPAEEVFQRLVEEFETVPKRKAGDR